MFLLQERLQGQGVQAVVSDTRHHPPAQEARPHVSDGSRSFGAGDVALGIGVGTRGRVPGVHSPLCRLLAVGP